MKDQAIGRKMQELRERQGLTTADLARRVGFSQTHVSRLENGKQGFRSETLLKISEALGVEPQHFFVEETTARAGNEAPVYGLAAGGELVLALTSPEFRQLAEPLAGAFLNRKRAFDAVRLAAKAIMDKT